jgi:hypothetical protein
MNTEKRLEQLGIEIPEILLPLGVDLRQWAVIACDQFTQDRAYWEKVKEETANSPSTLNLIFPEALIGDTNRTGKVEEIKKTMRHYLDSDIFTGQRRGLVYLERDTPFSSGRKGLLVAIDLEQYDWSPAARLLIRSTEGTVPERLPPRMDIRRNAQIETQHVLLLIDDDTNTLLPGMEKRAKKTAPVYNGKLMLNSGGISGWFLDSDEDYVFLANELEKLANRALTHYSTQPSSAERPFLFAVGDGNHSLASAKAIWEEYKMKFANANDLPVHPCRYALVEIENIYDPAVKFEPIHRIVFGLDFDGTLELLSALPDYSCLEIAGQNELVRLTAEPVRGNRFGVISGNAASGTRYALVETSAKGISTVCLQPLLDKKAGDSNGALSIDYIHGKEELFRLAASPEQHMPVTGILLPPVQKAGFFETIAQSGPMPRKSFSMGEAVEKRFYIECRKLFQE